MKTKEAMEKKANEPEKTEKTDLRVSSGDNIIPLSEKIGLADGIFKKVKVIKVIDVKEANQNLKEELRRYFTTKQSKFFIEKAFEKHYGEFK